MHRFRMNELEFHEWSSIKRFLQTLVQKKVCGILRMIFMPSMYFFLKFAVLLTFNSKSSVESKFFRT